MTTSTLQVGPPLVDPAGAGPGGFCDVANGPLGECGDDGALELEVGVVSCASECGESLTGFVGQGAALGHGHIMNCSRFGFTSVSESDTLGDMSTDATPQPTDRLIDRDAVTVARREALDLDHPDPQVRRLAVATLRQALHEMELADPAIGDCCPRLTHRSNGVGLSERYTGPEVRR